MAKKSKCAKKCQKGTWMEMAKAKLMCWGNSALLCLYTFMGY